jgi:hypothetical protein
MESDNRSPAEVGLIFASQRQFGVTSSQKEPPRVFSIAFVVVDRKASPEYDEIGRLFFSPDGKLLGYFACSFRPRDVECGLVLRAERHFHTARFEPDVGDVPRRSSAKARANPTVVNPRTKLEGSGAPWDTSTVSDPPLSE